MTHYVYLLYSHSAVPERVAYLVLDQPIAVGDILTLAPAPKKTTPSESTSPVCTRCAVQCIG
jgi:hypothetical protein